MTTGPFTISIAGGDAKKRTVVTAVIAQVLNALGCQAHLSDADIETQRDLMAAHEAAKLGALSGCLAQVASVPDDVDPGLILGGRTGIADRKATAAELSMGVMGGPDDE